MPPGLLILTYHRIAPADDHRWLQRWGSSAIAPARFEAHLRFLRGRLPILPLDEALARWRRDGRPPDGCVLTFDDGFRDGVTAATPILRALGCPAAFFVVTRAVGASELLAMHRLFLLLERADVRDWLAAHLPDAAPAARPLVTRVTDLLVRAAQAARARLLGECFERFPLDAAEEGRYARELYLDWEDVVALHRAGMTIGSHSATHESLPTLAGADRLWQAAESRTALERALDGATEVFAYPYGAADRPSAESVAAAGYSAGLAGGPRHPTCAGAPLDPLVVRRVGVDDDPLWRFKKLVYAFDLVDWLRGRR